MKSVTRFIKKTMKSVSKINIWIRLFVFLGVLFLVLNYINYHHPFPEGFTQMEKFKVNKNDELYDSYINRVLKNKLAIKIKVIDLMDNIKIHKSIDIKENGSIKLIQYENALSRIKAK